MPALVPNATGSVDDVLVAVRGAVGIGRLARVVAGLFGEMDTAVTLYHVAEEDETDEDVATLLDGLVDRLGDLGMETSRIETRVDRDQLAADVDGFVGADVAALCRAAATGAVRDRVQSLSGSEPTAVEDIVLTQAHFEAALAAIQAAGA